MIRKKTSKLSVPDAILIDGVDKNTMKTLTPPPMDYPCGLPPWTIHMDYPKLNFAADVK